MNIPVDNSSPTPVPKCIPATLRIGVTGHREIEREKSKVIIHSIHQIIDQLDIWFSSKLESTPHRYSILSPLAEGADRLVAEEILHWRNWRMEKGLNDAGEPQLEVVLPLPEEDYIQDFTELGSKNEFRALLSKRASLKIFPSTGSREKSYERAGHYVVDNCDVLVAIWDGMKGKGRGGTAEMVDYAKTRGRHIFWVNSENGKLEEEITPTRAGCQYIEALTSLNEFNREHLSEEKTQKNVEEIYSYLMKVSKGDATAADFLPQVKMSILPWYVRADLLAQRYQKRHSISSSAIYWLSALAVFMVTLYVLFFPLRPILLLTEVGAMALILILLWLSHWRGWQQKWIDYRFLAERLRAAIFLRPQGVKLDLFEPPPYLSLSHRQDDWMITAFIWVWNLIDFKPINFEPGLRDFLQIAWIDEQVRWYETKKDQLNTKHSMYSYCGYGLFFLTLIVGLVHFTQFFHPYSSMLSLLAIVLPGTGAAVHGIRSLRDYHRIAERYGVMADHLRRISNRFLEVNDLKTLLAILNEANEMMLREHQDWRIVIRFHIVTP